MRIYLTGAKRCGIMYTMKNKTPYQISTFSELCVLYVRSTKEVLKEGSYFYCDSIRQLNQLSKFKTNIVTKNFYEKVLLNG